MVLLNVGDTYTGVLNAPLQERETIRIACAAHPSGYQFMPRFKQGIWDGWISLYKYGKFPSGLLGRVCVALDEKSIAYDIDGVGLNDGCTEFDSSKVKDSLVGITLRDYQLQAVERCILLQRGILRMATNSGKTAVAAAIIQATGSKAVIVVPSRALLLQTADKLEAMLGISVGRIGAGYMQDESVTVTTMASLEKLAHKDLRDNRVIILDEAHHASAAQIFDNIFDIPGRYRIGMSGTPLKHDLLSDLKLIGATGEVIYEVSNSELIENGYSVRPIIKMHTVADSDTYYKADYQDAYRTAIVENDFRNELIAKIACEELMRGPVLILVNWIEHARAIEDFLPTATVATGQDSKDEIQNKLSRLATKEIPILIATEIFGEGIDIPAISTVIMAAGGKSHIRLLQRVGRGLRVAAGKDRLVVHDFIDDTNKNLLRHSEMRHRLYKAEGFEVKLVN